MRQGDVFPIEVSLVALYLRGAPNRGPVARCAWPRVWKALREADPPLASVHECLRSRGLFDEAGVVHAPDLLAWAEEVVESGRAVTAASPAYPSRWLRVLGSSAPPALWADGPLPEGPYLGVAGSRTLTARSQQFSRELGAEAARLGACVVSGGALGADRLTVRGALDAGGHAMEVVPSGLAVAGPKPGVCRLSPSEPDAEFTTGRAMERNALIYAAGPHAVVVQPRFQKGGTWHGAIEALRRRACQVWFMDAPGDKACRALAALGAKPLASPAGLAEALASEPPMAQPDLFGDTLVREREADYANR